MDKRHLQPRSIKFDANVQCHTGEELRLMFDMALLQPAPDQFMEFIQILKIQEGDPE